MPQGRDHRTRHVEALGRRPQWLHDGRLARPEPQQARGRARPRTNPQATGPMATREAAEMTRICRCVTRRVTRRVSNGAPAQPSPAQPLRLGDSTPPVDLKATSCSPKQRVGSADESNVWVEVSQTDLATKTTGE